MLRAESAHILSYTPAPGNRLTLRSSAGGTLQMTVLHNGVIMKATQVHEDFHLTCTVLVKCANLLSRSPLLSLGPWDGEALLYG